METLCKSFIIHLLKDTDFAEDEEQIEVYVYGLLSFVYTWIPLGILCVIAVCCGCFFEMLLWNLCFVTFRNYAGGYHAPHPALCLACSVLLGVSSIVVLNADLAISYSLYCGCLICFLLVCLPSAPMTRKEFSSQTRIQCKMKLVILTISCAVIFAFFPAYRIVPLHAATCTMLLCITEKLLRQLMIKENS